MGAWQEGWEQHCTPLVPASLVRKICPLRRWSDSVDGAIWTVCGQGHWWGWPLNSFLWGCLHGCWLWGFLPDLAGNSWGETFWFEMSIDLYGITLFFCVLSTDWPFEFSLAGLSSVRPPAGCPWPGLGWPGCAPQVGELGLSRPNPQDFLVIYQYHFTMWT